MNPERSIALIHSYLGDRKGKNKPDRLTRTSILAASELYRRGEISNVYITVEPGLAKPMVEQLRKNLQGFPEEDLIVEPQTVTTEEEIKHFKERAEKEGWNNLITIGNRSHLPRIRRIINRRFKNTDIKITSVAAREILSHHSRYKQVLEDMEIWPEQHSLERQETIINRIEKFPLIGRIIVGLTPQLLPGKVAFQTWIFRQMEKQKRVNS